MIKQLVNFTMLLASLGMVTPAFAAGRLVDSDFRTLSDIQARGGTVTNLLNDSKIAVTANGINDTLYNTILNGQIGAGGGGQGIELLPNPGMESGGLQGYTASGGSLTLASAGAIIAGKKSAVFQATAIGQTVSSAAIPIQGLAGGNCSVQTSYMYAGNAGDYSLQAYNGSTVLNSIALPVSTSAAVPTTISFPCGTSYSSTLAWRLISNVASPQAITYDTNHLGSFAQLISGLVNGMPTNIVRYLTGSGTYIPSAGVTQIRVRMVGGGGGGAGSGSAAGTGQTAGGTTTFGTLICTGGGAGTLGTTPPSGGTATIGSGATGFSFQGSQGGPSAVSAGTGSSVVAGGTGGASLFSGAGAAGGAAFPSGAAIANSGSGGGGGSSNGTLTSGSGGASGGYIEAIITSPASSYSYSVGSAGAAGAAGTSGTAPGSAGAAGQIYIEETFQSVTQQSFLPSAGGLAAGDTVSGAWASCPTGTILADGSAVSRTTQSALFNAIGTAYGTGDGSTTFNLPLISQIGGSTPLVSYGTTTVTATTTAPVKGATTSIDIIKAEQSTGDQWKIKGDLKFSSAPTSTGSGDYLWSLPNNLQFDPAKVIYTTTAIGGGTNYGTQGSIGQWSAYGGGTGQAFGQIYPYDATHFRMIGSSSSAGSGYTIGAVGTGFFQFASGATYSFDFEAPILSYANSYLKTCIRTQAASAAPLLIGTVQSTDAKNTVIINTSQTYTAAATIPNTIETAFGDTTTAAFTLTLPDPTVNKSKKLIISKTNSGANLLGVTGNIAGTAGKTTYLHGQSELIQFQSDGTTWQWLSDAYRTEYLYMAGSSSTPTVTSQTGNWVASITRNATGDYTVIPATNVFASYPICVGSSVSDNVATNTTFTLAMIGVNTPTFIRFTVRYTQGGTVQSADGTPAYLSCKGLR